jgi:hypothetical protein
MIKYAAALLEDIKIDYNDNKEYKMVNKMFKISHSIGEKEKDMTCIKELLVEYKNKKGEKII